MDAFTAKTAFDRTKLTLPQLRGYVEKLHIRHAEVEEELVEAARKIAVGKEHAAELLRDLAEGKKKIRKIRAKVSTGDKPFGERQLSGALQHVVGRLRTEIAAEVNGNSVRADELLGAVAKEFQTPATRRDT